MQLYSFKSAKQLETFHYERRGSFSLISIPSFGLKLGAFFWGYSGYSYFSLGITEYTEFKFRKERSYMFQIWKWNRRGPENYYICARDRRGRPRRISHQKCSKIKERVFCLFGVNRIPSILFILLSGAE